MLCTITRSRSLHVPLTGNSEEPKVSDIRGNPRLDYHRENRYISTMIDESQHDRFMKTALAEAERAYELGETPVGAVIVKNGSIIGRGGNRIETLHDPTAHAEILAIGAACETTGYERLVDSIMYVTLEPCVMYAGAIIQARIPILFYGAADPKAGACGSVLDICGSDKLNHTVQLTGGIMQEECAGILRHFFQQLRARNKQGGGFSPSLN